MADLKDGITACIFAYNEETEIEKSVYATLESLISYNYNFEIIIVDDGSIDRTRTRALNVGRVDSRIKIVSHPINLGPTESMRTAARLAQFKNFFLIPGDYTYDSIQTKKMIDCLPNVSTSPATAILGIRYSKRIRRGVLREMASRMAVMSLIWINPKQGFLPDVGFILAPTFVVLDVPTGVRGYGQGIGLIGMILMHRLPINYTKVSPTPGSEKRSSSLSFTKILDIARTHISLIAKSIKKNRVTQ